MVQCNVQLKGLARGQVTGKAGRDRALAKIVAHAPNETPKTGRVFLKQYYAHLAEEDLEAFEPGALVWLALHHLKTARKRKSGTPLVHLFNPDKSDAPWRVGHTVVEIVSDDMPFLFDSITAAINARGIRVHLAVHPVVRTRRTATGQISEILEPGLLGVDKDAHAESYIHLHIDEQPAARLDELRAGLMEVLTDVRQAVGDWRAMRDELMNLITEMESFTQELALDDVSEVRDFLRWVHDDHFTLLGFREYEFSGTGSRACVTVAKGSGLGVLKDPRRVVIKELRDLAKMPPDVRAFIARPDLLKINKTDVVSRVHRPVLMDSISVKRLDAKGRVVGQRMFVGLFTASAYNRSVRDIPLLRRKIQNTFDAAALPLSGHDGKALLNILETYPRDELFQISEQQLLEIGLGILRLQDRQRVALFLRKDDFERFYSCLIYVPRDRYTTDLRRKFQAVLEEGLGGTVTAHYAQLGEQALARLHVVVQTTPGNIPAIDRGALEQRMAAMAQSWSDRLGGVLIDAHGEWEGMRLLDSYQDAFGRGYEDRFSAMETLDDIKKIELTYVFGRLGLHLYELNAPEGPPLRFKIYHPYTPVALSDVLPMLEHMGLRVMEEIPFRVQPKGRDHAIVMHEFGLEPRGLIPGAGDDVRHRFHEAFDRIWDGLMESDGLNALILMGGLDWREVTVLRAYTKYLRQTGIAFSEEYMARTLLENAVIARLIVDLFKARFALMKTEAEQGKAARAAASLTAKLYKMLDDVSSADQDLILRRFINLVSVTLRTNFHQSDTEGEPKTWLSFKLASGDVEGLPLPRPKFEIFVYAPEVEGVHLRFGNVARGGLRWSDRREDFRTEVLGLVKAQQVKNAVIVPVGSKGGFVVKRPPAPGASREEVLDSGIACYKTFVRGLLDLTDNINVSGHTVGPKDVTRIDGDDPYLVVAADKGTATFSDIANSVSAEYGFWLGDAFASGGSQGYDHKKMGITAKGAWESVKRHFREMGRDTQSQDFTVAGVGDMSGDVFGNGLLLSPHIKLVAAFNHMHIFIDPNPDPAKSFKERQRLFNLPRSGWGDYDPKLISKGGGVFDRRSKRLDLSKEMQALLGVDQERLSPNDVMTLILKLDVDLMWFGGIGTYVKSSAQNHADVGDRTNDAIRVDGCEVRARVIGEGANLGFTQRGRIEYALNGGRLNADSIDNSAGVDCSDHEVNIKILLDALVQQKKLTPRARNALLVRMTDEVGKLVLRDNYEQTQAISLIEAHSVDAVDHQLRLMHRLEKSGKLNRKVEYLPQDDQLIERAASGKGLTRPEIAVLMSYSKIWLFDELLASDLPDDAFLTNDLTRYFPTPLQKTYGAGILQHRLRREIVATRVTNSLINRVGGTFVTRIMEKTGMKSHEIARAYIVARECFEVRALWAAIEALDAKVSATVQTAMLMDINRLLEQATMWFLRNGQQPLALTETVERFKAGVTQLAAGLSGALPEHYVGDLATRAAHYIDQGVPEDLAIAIAGLVNLVAATDIVTLAERRKLDPTAVAKLYFAVGSRFHLGRLRAACEALDGHSHWQKLAVSALIEELFGHQMRLTENVLVASTSIADPGRAIEQWVRASQASVERAEQLLGELWGGDIGDIAMIAVASRTLKSLSEQRA
ncbi:MAG: NAD-glutamate dehydrogenase [Rhodospirillales bacterium]|nr:NAD-glutamate dehydrogenase [Rhodospirillales bacterium]